MEQRRNIFNIFTDGSKTPDGAGAAIFFNEINLRQPYKLPNHCTGPSKSVLVYALHSLEYVLGLARFRVFVPKLLYILYIKYGYFC